MSSELTALMHCDTWQLVLLPKGCNIIWCKWVFPVKRLANGSIDKFKVRLVEKGFNQSPGLDYKETFSPIVRQVTIRTILSIVVMQGCPLRQLDVNNSFLHSHLTEKVYMTQPLGFRDQANQIMYVVFKKLLMVSNKHLVLGTQLSNKHY